MFCSMKDTFIVFAFILDALEIVIVLTLCFRYYMLRKQKDNEYYTDYKHKGLVLRVFKEEFEYQALGRVPIEKILDRGVLSKFYLWALIEE